MTLLSYIDGRDNLIAAQTFPPRFTFFLKTLSSDSIFNLVI